MFSFTYDPACTWYGLTNFKTIARGNNTCLLKDITIIYTTFGPNGGTWIQKPTPTYLWQDVAYPGTRQAGYNHIPTQLIYESMTWGIK